MATKYDVNNNAAGLISDMNHITLTLQLVQRILKQPPGLRGTTEYLPDHARAVMAELERLRRQVNK